MQSRDGDLDEFFFYEVQVFLFFFFDFGNLYFFGIKLELFKCFVQQEYLDLLMRFYFRVLDGVVIVYSLLISVVFIFDEYVDLVFIFYVFFQF